MTEPELKFEKALERLEKIVEDLESGNMPLEDALKKYEEGVKLSRLCAQKLTQAESKIEVLTRTLNGALESAPLEAGGATKKSGQKKAKKREPEPDSSGDELLL
ncbi:MAG: exodeoxyribonuclease VII small subunit [Candidatus Omnitrophica bacterium]|nr:exodeoxyribonuclease VII small subunit [Candidatus Omnitrophota bacterium]